MVTSLLCVVQIEEIHLLSVFLYHTGLSFSNRQSSDESADMVERNRQTSGESADMVERNRLSYDECLLR